MGSTSTRSTRQICRVVLTQCVAIACLLSLLFDRARAQAGPPEDLGVEINSAPSAVDLGAGRIEVFYRGPNNHLWMIAWPDASGSAWGAPVDLGGQELTSAPSAVSQGVGQIDVFYRGPNNHLWMSSWPDPSGHWWGPPADLGGVVLASAPTAISHDAGQISVFYRGVNNHLWTSSWPDASGHWWAPPADLGGVALTSRPSAVALGGARMSVVYRGPENQLYSSAFPDQGGKWWGPPVAVPGTFLRDDPSAVLLGSDAFNVVYLDSAANLMQTSWSGPAPNSWKRPIGLGVKLPSAPDGTVEGRIFYRGANGHLWQLKLSVVPKTTIAAFPRYNEVYGTATHNSYWINRSDQVDYFSSGTQEVLSDQLLHEHVRAIEIDLHSEGSPAHDWNVYHTSSSEDYSCKLLSDCLEYLRNFQYADPNHEVINVVLELKNVVSTRGFLDNTGRYVTNYNFDKQHTPDDLDALFEKALGSHLYTPREFLARCAPGLTILACARVNGWPRIDELRGKVIVNILGNWASAARDWVVYAAGDMQRRVAFPMQSVFALDSAGVGGVCPDITNSDPAHLPRNVVVQWNGRPHCIRDLDESVNSADVIDARLRQVAFDASVFWQLEALSGPAYFDAQEFLKEGGIIRGGDSFDFGTACLAQAYPPGDPWNCQERRVEAGFQLLQTDYPWHVLDDDAAALGLPTDPSQRFKDPGVVRTFANPRAQPIPLPGAPFHEPGARIYVRGGTVSPAWAYEFSPSVSKRWWEATVSVTRNGKTWGENTHDGLIVDDYLLTCPVAAHPQTGCTDYARSAREGGSGCIKVSAETWTIGMQVCRLKDTQPGPSYYQEAVDISVTVYQPNPSHPGQAVSSVDKLFRAARYAPCKTRDQPNSDDVSDICVGSLIALAVENRGSRAVVTAYSAGKLTAAGAPDWHPLLTYTFAAPMTRQGFSAGGDVLFVGVRRDTASVQPSTIHPQDVNLKSLPGRLTPVSGQVIVDLSYPL